MFQVTEKTDSSFPSCYFSTRTPDTTEFVCMTKIKDKAITTKATNHEDIFLT